MSQFFIKRGDKAHGPFSESQIKAGLKSGKLSQKDLVSKDRSGPWRAIKGEAAVEKEIPSQEVEDDVVAWLDDDTSDNDVQDFTEDMTGDFSSQDHAAIPSNQSIPETPDTKTCPYCAEDIKAAAVKCKHCGEILDDTRKASRNAPQPLPASNIQATGNEVRDGEVIECPACHIVVSRWAPNCPSCGMPNPGSAMATPSQITVKFDGVWMLVDCKFRVVINDSELGVGKIVKGGAVSGNVNPGINKLTIKGPMGRNYATNLKIIAGKSYTVTLIYSRTIGWFNNCKITYA